MYKSYFGMKQRPFGATPHLGAYYTAATHEEAIATLRYAITQGRGLAVLTGPPGTGKTIVCHRLAASLEANFTAAMVTNTSMTTTKALLQAILYDLSLPYRGMDEQELRLNLSDFLLGKYSGGGRTVLIIDEAQNLTPPLLEELRMLGNLEGDTDKLLQIVLVGHPRLLATLRQPELETLSQRIAARATVGALSDEETVDYVRHQLQYAGVLPEKVFTYGAMTAVYEATGGVPRLINQLCEHALLLAYVAEASAVDERMVEQASADLNRSADAGVTTSEEADEQTVSGSPPPSGGAPQETLVIKSRPPRVAVAERLESLPAREHSPEIIKEELGPIPLASAVKPTAAPQRRNAAEDPRAEIFEQEEVIVDQYAIMDAARDTKNRPAAADRNSPQAAEKQRAIRTSRADVTVLPLKQPPAGVSLFGDVFTGAVADATPAPSAASSTAFVGPADEPATFEVGAGLPAHTAKQPAAKTEPEILVIEDRSKRIAGNLGRIDGPQPAVAPGKGTYRRLFTYARKS